MRLEPGRLEGIQCLSCGGDVYAVKISQSFMSVLTPQCEKCGLSPAEAYLKHRPKDRPA